MVDKIWYNMEELIGGSEERVLIETYWNVKINAYNLIWNEWFRINRNILECKGALPQPQKGDDVVLIETYWNVKCEKGEYRIVAGEVLIETYWNVK